MPYLFGKIGAVLIICLDFQSIYLHFFLIWSGIIFVNDFVHARYNKRLEQTISKPYLIFHFISDLYFGCNAATIWALLSSSHKSMGEYTQA